MPRPFLIMSILTLLAACTREPAAPCGGEATVHIVTSLASMPAATKNPVTGTAFPNNWAYGLFVCEQGSTSTAHKSNSRNIKSLYSDGRWRYYYVGNLGTGAVAPTAYEDFTLTVREDGAAADLYAYAPYTQSAFSSGPAAIPYTLASRITDQADLMYAVENLDPAANVGLDPGAGCELSAAFTFRHVFALLEFRFKLVKDAASGAYGTGSSYSVTDIGVTLNDPDGDGITTARLYTSGSFNALTGSFNPGATERTSLQVNYSPYYPTVSSATSAATAHLLLVPTEVDDDELVFTFTVNGQTLQPFSLKKSYLLHEDGVTYGFRSGFKYTFHFTLDNYICFDGFSVSSDWSGLDLGTEEI